MLLQQPVSPTRDELTNINRQRKHPELQPSER
jgi:hypothetical protein